MFLLRTMLTAIMQNSCPARLRLRLVGPLRLPLSLLPGASPVQAVKCFSPGHLLSSMPVSPMICKTLYCVCAGNCVRSRPPHICANISPAKPAEGPNGALQRAWKRGRKNVFQDPLHYIRPGSEQAGLDNSSL